jgi:hypothetical protein
MTFPKLPKQLRFLSKLSYGKRIHPARDWFIILIVSFLLVLASVAWNAWLFLNAGNETGAVTPQTQADAGLSTQALANVQAVFQKRATEETFYQTTYHFPDPSL